MKIHKLLKRARERAKYSQRELRARLGYSSVATIETDSRNMIRYLDQWLEECGQQFVLRPADVDPQVEEAMERAAWVVSQADPDMRKLILKQLEVWEGQVPSRQRERR